MARTAITLSLAISMCTVIPTLGFAYPAIIGQPGGEPGAEFIYGDATGNGVVTADDATVMLGYYVGLIDGSSIQVSASDVDSDGNVTVIDALLVSQYKWDYHSLDETLIATFNRFESTSSHYGVNPSSMVNNTGEVWTGFRIRLDTYTSDFFAVQSQEFFFLEDAYEGPGTYTLSNQNRTLDIAGLDIGVGDSFDFFLNFTGSDPGYYGVFGQPTAIPEPNTLVFVTSGLIGLVGFRRRLGEGAERRAGSGEGRRGVPPTRCTRVSG